ncbi:MAG: hypothetical protein M3422_03370 [Actinomycetota bacterium]|nr:hypothetical protein [Actinomycetota bacterium]
MALLQPAIQRGRRSPEAWRDAVQSLATRLWTLQVAAASYADAYLNDILDAQDADPVAEGRVNPQAFADLTDGGGSWLQALVFAPNSVRPDQGADWSRFGFVANSIVKTGLADTARAAVQSGMQARPAVTGYVRMLQGTSCARCAILAGRRYKSATAFDRHKRCDCIHIPAAEDATDDWTTDSNEYFQSLSREEQDRLFTKAGAEAIRMGADMAQVVNARQGITVAQAFGQTVQATTVGTTSRGLAGQRLQGRIPRLLPDEIFLQAERLGWDRAETLRQLRRFAYVV